MADEQEDTQQGEETEAGSNTSGMIKMIVFGVVGLAVIGGITFAVMMFLGDDAPTREEQLQMANEAAGEPGTVVGEEDEQSESTADAIYHKMRPYTVSLQGDDSHRFLQVAMAVMSRDDDAIDAVKDHDPAIRDAMTMLFSSQTYQSLATREGKETLRQHATDAINQILDENGVETSIERVYFTSLLVD